MPAVTVCVLEPPEAIEIVKSNPLPASGTTCGLFPALSEMFIVAVREPPACGVNVTVIVQVVATSN